MSVSIFQNDFTSISVFWTPPSPMDKNVGYHIYYTGPTSGNVSVDSVELNSYVISGLVNGEFYHVSVAGKSLHFESEPVMASQNPLGLSKFNL